MFFLEAKHISTLLYLLAQFCADTPKIKFWFLFDPKEIQSKCIDLTGVTLGSLKVIRTKSVTVTEQFLIYTDVRFTPQFQFCKEKYLWSHTTSPSGMQNYAFSLFSALEQRLKLLSFKQASISIIMSRWQGRLKFLFD